MAYKNKTQLAATISALAATADLELHDKPQRNEIVDSLMCLLDRDLIISTSESSSVSLDFSGVDLIKSTLTNSGLTIDYNISGIQTGDIKFLWINKLGGDNISFSGVTSLIQDSDYFDAYIGETLFVLIKKGGSSVTYLIPTMLLGEYLKVSGNGSDISNISEFRTNIDVYSKSEIIAILSTSESLSFDYTDKYSSFGTTVLNGKQNNNVYSITGTVIITANGSTTARKLAKINEYISPGYNVYFSFGVRQIYEGASGYIDVDGNIYLLWGQNSAEPFAINVTWII